MDIATAGLTKKGQILLTTTHMKNADMPLTKVPGSMLDKIDWFIQEVFSLILDTLNVLCSQNNV